MQAAQHLQELGKGQGDVPPLFEKAGGVVLRVKHFPRLVVDALVWRGELLPCCGGGGDLLSGVLRVLMPVKVCVVVCPCRIVCLHQRSDDSLVMVPPARGAQQRLMAVPAWCVARKGTVHQMVVIFAGDQGRACAGLHCCPMSMSIAATKVSEFSWHKSKKSQQYWDTVRCSIAHA